MYSWASYHKASTESVGGLGWPGIDATTVARMCKVYASSIGRASEFWPCECNRICSISVYSYLCIYTLMHEHLLIHPTGRHLATPPPTCELLDSLFTLSIHELKMSQQHRTPDTATDTHVRTCMPEWIRVRYNSVSESLVLPVTLWHVYTVGRC